MFSDSLPCLCLTFLTSLRALLVFSLTYNWKFLYFENDQIGWKQVFRQMSDLNFCIGFVHKRRHGLEGGGGIKDFVKTVLKA
jgi:hypothetical protein